MLVFVTEILKISFRVVSKKRESMQSEVASFSRRQSAARVLAGLSAEEPGIGFPEGDVATGVASDQVSRCAPSQGTDDFVSLNGSEIVVLPVPQVKAAITGSKGEPGVSRGEGDAF